MFPFHWLIAAILLIGVLQGMVIGIIFLLKRSGNIRANLFFGVLLLVFSLALYNNFCYVAAIYEYYPQWQLYPVFLTLSIGPLLFYFVKFTLFPTYQLRPTDSKHFVLPISQFVFYSYTAFLSVSRKEAIIEQFIDPYLAPLEGLLFLLSFFGYLLLAYRYVRYKQALLRRSKRRWEFEKINWVRRVLKMLFLLGSINSAYVIVNYVWLQFTGLDLFGYPFFFYLVHLSFATMVFWLGFFGYNHEFLLLSNNPSYQKALLDTSVANERNFTPNEQLFRTMEQVVQSRQLYLDPDLNRLRLAQRLGISSAHLRRILDHAELRDFQQWLAEFRVREVVKRLERNFDKEVSATIGLDVGFPSRRSFRSAFLRVTGQTFPNFIQTINRRKPASTTES